MAYGTYTCRNHPTYRWTKNKCGPDYIGRGILQFVGEEGGLPGSPFNETEADLAKKGAAYAEHFRKAYTAECDCPGSDLVLIRLTPDHPDERAWWPSDWQAADNGSWVKPAYA